MSIKERIAQSLFGTVIDGLVAERLKAASVADLEREDEGWRRLTGNTNRNLSPLKQQRMFDIAYYLWENNPMAGWLIDITVSFLLAEGLPYECKNEKVKEVLDAFWQDPLNRMDLYFEKHVAELLIFGELCFPAFVAEQTGKVRLGFIDPARIKEVACDPENVKLIIGVVLMDLSDNPGKAYRTVLPEEADHVMSKKARALRNSFDGGECFFFGINNVTNSPRGRSELLSVADWLDAYEQYLFDSTEKWSLFNTFVWDLLVAGDENEIKKHVSAFTKKSGSIYGHNEKVTLTPSAPDLKSVDTDAAARLIRNHILGRKGFPEHWYGGGGDVNRATAAEMDAPAIKMLSQRQAYVKYILEEILRYVIAQARDAGYLRVTDEEAADWSVVTPEISTKDITKLSTAVRDIATALVVAEQNQWVSKGAARNIFSVITGFIGIEIDPDKMLSEIEEERETEGYDDYTDGKRGTADQKSGRKVAEEE
jgi:hypothetical protein